MSKQTLFALRATGMSFGVALLLALLGWVSLNQPALAVTDQPLDIQASITVNTNSPAIASDGLCSMIEAIENANFDASVHADCAAGNGADAISLPPDAVIIFTTTHNGIDGGNALPVITSTVSIAGNNATLVRDANIAPTFRFFNVAVDGDLTLDALGMRHGRAGVGGTLQLLFGGGAIVNSGSLQISNSNLSFNSASFGGAIYSQPVTGSLSINNTTFSSNHADFFGGAVYNFGPGEITGGLLRSNTADGDGGAILQDSSTLVLSNVTLRDNVVMGTGAGIAARALVTDSQLLIESSQVISNLAATHGGGIANTAANGLTSLVHITGSLIIANRVTSTSTLSGIGGGLLNGWAQGDAAGVAEMHVQNSSITDNVAQVGGGVANLDVAGQSTRRAQLVILQSTLARNTAAGVGSNRGAGGGLYNSNGLATVANSTFSGNQALGDDEETGGRGGGIGIVGRGVTTTLQLLNSTIALNEATQAGGGIAVIGQVTTSLTVLDVGNTLVVSNALSVTQSVSNAVVLAEIAAPQVITGTESCTVEDGAANSLGGNIEDGNTCQFDTATDLQETTVALGPLANNGGSTLTHLITEGGAAFDGGLDDLCVDAPVGGVDQRGVTRPQAEDCDVGAVELVTDPPIDEPEEPVMYFPQMYKFFLFP